MDRAHDSRKRAGADATRRTRAHRAPDPAPRPPIVPVVALGASAGGLAALTAFLAHVPAGTRVAFVVVQHLDPTHAGMLAALLGRATDLPVVEAEEGMPAAPGRVHVIPRGHDLEIADGRFRLLPPEAARRLHLPIDRFLRSLAADSGLAAAGVILSGMGADGTEGLRAIRAAGGRTFAQAPESAAFDGMPRSAIAAGVVDIVAAPAELPAHVLAGPAWAARPAAGAEAAATHEEAAFERILAAVRRASGVDFTGYKRATLERRIRRRVAVHRLGSLAAYADHLAGAPDEAALLQRELLIGVTRFFRDADPWARLASEVLPGLLAERRAAGLVRAWVPGCSTGEEAYTLAILLREAADRMDPPWQGTIRIFATDVDEDAIAQARRGRYPATIAADLTPARLARHFSPDTGGGYRVRRELRSLVVFARQDIVADPPFTRVDLVSCRNLLIYLGPALQATVVPLLHHALNPGGILLLGSAESAGGRRDLFAPLGGRDRIYRRVGLPDVPGLALPRSPVLPAAGASLLPAADARGLPAGVPDTELRTHAERALLARFAPAAVLTTAEGDIVYIHGRTGTYLEPAAGKADWNVLAMARDAIRPALAAAFRRAVAEGARVTVADLAADDAPDTRPTRLTVEPLAGPGPLAGLVLVAFPAGPDAPRRGRGRGTPLPPEPEAVRALREELARTRAEMAASQAELRTASEEHQSASEELQSLNEELTTANEELHSMNEELQVVNAELGARIEDLVVANSDMENLIAGSELATVFLDGRLRIRRFTASATRLVNLIPGDVGRPLGDVTTTLDYPELLADAARVLRTLAISDREVRARSGRWYAVRIVPYRTGADVVDGVVLTFTEVTRLKELEAALAAVGGDGTP